MKKNFLFLLLFTFVFCQSCSDDNGSTITDPFGGGGNGGVTFTMGASQGQQGIIFTTTPSQSVKITKVIVSLPAQQFTEEIAVDGTTVFNAGETVQIEEFTGVAAGQQWTFQFEGSLASNNQSFNVTSNYTIQ